MIKNSDVGTTPPTTNLSCCPRCGTRFVCGMASGQETCWCASLPAITLPDPARPECLCPDCLRAIATPSC